LFIKKKLIWLYIIDVKLERVLKYSLWMSSRWEVVFIEIPYNHPISEWECERWVLCEDIDRCD